MDDFFYNCGECSKRVTPQTVHTYEDCLRHKLRNGLVLSRRNREFLLHLGIEALHLQNKPVGAPHE